MRLALSGMSKTCVVTLLLIFAVHVGRAQTASVAAKDAGAQKPGEDLLAYRARPASGDTRYRIGPGDVLEVRVARAPELSRDSVRVDQGGMIRMPMLDVDIPAASRTVGEVSQNTAKRSLIDKHDSHADVLVKEL